MKDFFNNLPRFTKSFYFIFGMSFLLWMLFLDGNDFYSQYKLTKKLHDLENEKEWYLEKVEEVKKDRKELLTNKALLEKFAREKYLMKKPTEDIYIVTEEE